MNATGQGPDDLPETMTGAEFRALRESLALSSKWLADRWNITERTVLRWEYDQSPVRDWAAAKLRAIAAEADEETDRLTTERQHGKNPIIWTYRTDAELHADRDLTYPAAWHRAAAYRAAAQIHARLDYWTAADGEH